MDNLKLYAKSERKLDLFIHAIKAFSDDVSNGIWSGKVCGSGREEGKDSLKRGN